MKNADLPAMPVIDWDIKDGKAVQFTSSEGLTKREHFAAMAMKGLLSSDDSSICFYKSDSSAQHIAESAVAYADALLAELERTK